MIVITGATGRLGGAVLRELLARIPADELGISTTSPGALQEAADRGIRVRRGDYDDPASLAHAFDGADRVLLVSAPRIGEAATTAHRIAIDAARDAGVDRLFYTSHVGADALSPFPPAVTHAATEVMLRESGVPFTAVRNGFYADTPVRLVQDAVAQGELRLPADGPVSWTTHDDLAPAIAALLLDPAIDDTVVNLTARAAVDADGLAAIASTIAGRPIPLRRVGDEDYRAALLADGVPEVGAHMSLAIFQAARQRRFGIVDPRLESLIGRPSRTLEDVVTAVVGG
ncbi:NAD(P)H-binding protein [Labedella endophytica]|uniref:SDR family NAD(P)-dependent oxidoreductase n=1 Tax=Labedella endophytica TaxID=1523160 RepID=A0A433JV98_9MICO|nr:NAD(P)H-binding protein [Labedella endophytica]RUR03086.1 SDR family NAD(P)-dependent oxidoreductase [Labedella endophytica]